VIVLIASEAKRDLLRVFRDFTGRKHGADSWFL